MDLSFFKNKKVLVSGHTGFKGSWLSRVLIGAGAEVTGYSLEPATEPSLFALAQIDRQMQSVIADIRDLVTLEKTFAQCSPDIVFHLAAQPLVRDAYEKPVYTYETNVMGTVNILECARKFDSVRSVLNVTTDKVYENQEWAWGYRENDPLDGFDPYSNSKSCSELVTHCYKNSFFANRLCAVSTARAGNVIGGGDFSKDRILPDCIRAAQDNEAIIVRNPNSIRPYQHVLEPIFAYLLIAERQYHDNSLSGWYNVGPADGRCITTGELVDLFCNGWHEELKSISQNDNGPHEANFLKLDCSKIQTTLGWQPLWDLQTAVEKTIAWVRGVQQGQSPEALMDGQIHEYLTRWKRNHV